MRKVSSSMVPLYCLAALGVSCGAGTDNVQTLPPVECQYVTLPARFCGPSEDEMLWRESNPSPARVCNGCLTDEECLERPGGVASSSQVMGATTRPSSVSIQVIPAQTVVAARADVSIGKVGLTALLEEIFHEATEGAHVIEPCSRELKGI